jgi:succinylglutamic semialdehyde dehydrogenase
LLVPQGKAGDDFVEKLMETVRKIRVGAWNGEPEPFMGPVVNDAAATKLLDAQNRLMQQGGKVLVEMRSIGPRAAFLSPGLIDVTAISQRADEECFGPLLQVIRIKDFDEALIEANHTEYGLSAGLLSDNRSLYEKFFGAIRAGIVNWNRPITGASGSLPFGGVGQSGNHRPSGYYAVDYCSYPVASMEGEKLELPAKLSPGLTI